MASYKMQRTIIATRLHEEQRQAEGPIQQQPQQTQQPQLDQQQQLSQPPPPPPLPSAPLAGIPIAPTPMNIYGQAAAPYMFPYGSAPHLAGQMMQNMPAPPPSLQRGGYQQNWDPRMQPGQHAPDPKAQMAAMAQAKAQAKEGPARKKDKQAPASSAAVAPAPKQQTGPAAKASSQAPRKPQTGHSFVEISVGSNVARLDQETLVKLRDLNTFFGQWKTAKPSAVMELGVEVSSSLPANTNRCITADTWRSLQQLQESLAPRT